MLTWVWERRENYERREGRNSMVVQREWSQPIEEEGGRLAALVECREEACTECQEPQRTAQACSEKWSNHNGGVNAHCTEWRLRDELVQ